MSDPKYKCPRCHYTTDVFSNYKQHLSRKKECPSTHSDISAKIILLALVSEKISAKKFECKNCKKCFKSASSRSHHYEICKPKSAPIDETILASLREIMANGGTNNSHNTNNNSHNNNSHNNNNNQYIQNNNIVVLRDFGNENMEALPKSLISDLILDLKYRELLENLHCDPDFPENHNIKLTSNKRKIIEIYKNNKWNHMTFVNAFDEILAHANNIFHNHFRKYKHEIAEDMTEEELEELEEKLYQVRDGLDEKFIKPIHTEIQLLLEAHRAASKNKKEDDKYVISRPAKLVGDGASQN